jgi:tetratricopeptide (TPR) repeat protein
VLGLAAGLFFGGLIWAVLHHWRRTALTLIGSSMAVVVCLALINLPNSPLDFVQDVPFLDRITRLSDAAGSTQGRVLIWQGTTDLLADRPERLLLGYGPDTIRFVLYPHYTAELGRLHGWRAFADRAHSETFDVLVTTGLLGLLGYLLLFTSIVYYGLRWLGLMATPRQRLLFLSLWALGGLLAVGLAQWIGQTWAFSGVALPLGLLAGLFCYLSVSIVAPSERPSTPGAAPRYMALVVALLVGLLAHFVETNVGIAVSTTYLLFWIYAALLIVVGVFFVHRSPDPPPQAEAEAFPPKRSKNKRKGKKKTRAAAKSSALPNNNRRRSDLPALALFMGLVLMTLVYSFAGYIERSPAVQGLLGGTWLLAGGVLLLSKRGIDLRAISSYAVLSLLPMLLFVWLSSVFFQRPTSQVLLFYGMLFGLMGGVAFALYRLAPRAERTATPWDLALMAVALLGAVWIIYQTNVQPILANLYHREAQVAFQKRQYDLAATSYWHTTDLDPMQDVYKLEYAQLLATKAHFRTPEPAERNQLFEEAERILQEAMATNPHEQYHPAALGDVYRLWAKTTNDPNRRNARYAQAAAAYDEALAINRQNVLLWRQAASLYEEMGDAGRARQAYERMLTWDSTNVGVRQRLAALYQANNDIPKAIAAYEALLRHHAQPQPVHYHTLATLYAQVDRLAEAIQASEQAVTLAPNVLAYQTTLMDLYERQGRCHDALARAEAAIQRWPDQPALRTRYQNLLQQCDVEPGAE